MLNILLVDSEIIFANALANILQSIPAQKVLDIVPCLCNLENLCIIHRPQVVIIRNFVSGQHNSFRMVAQMKKSFPEIKVIMILKEAKEAYVDEAKLCSVDSCVLATDAPASYHECLWATMKGEHVFPEVVKDTWGDAGAVFSDKERQIVRLLCQDFTVDEISEQLGITKRSVSYHIKNVLDKTGHKGILGVVLEAVKKGYVL